ncbi:MAG: DNA integrity scanning diadenylate cyclase DisA [Actinomycetota bacterium]
MRDLDLRSTLAAVAPGTDLRDGLERILRGRTGAIVVLGHDETVDSLCSGGFELDIEFTAARLRELAKMDGAVVVDFAHRRIRRANVQLLPDPTIESLETGMRHRTAERVSRQTGYPVISVSQSMRIIALYVGGVRHVLEGSDLLLSKANQALATLERYQHRFDEVLATLSALEIEDLVTVRDVVAVAQRMEMVMRIWYEIDSYVIQLGTDGRLLRLQVEELVSGIGQDRELLLEDYGTHDAAGLAERLAALEPPQLANPVEVARALRLIAGSQGLETPLAARGYRLLSRIPRLPHAVAVALVEHAGSLQRLLSATSEELQQVEGVGPLRARAIREGLSRLAESSILEQRFV